MVVVVPVLIPIVVVVPVMIVFKPATISIPITRIKLLSIVVRFDPSSACIGRPRPVAFMPLVVVAGRIPITIYPRELRARTSRHNANHTGTRRRTDSDANRNLSLRCRCSSQQHHGKQQGCANKISGNAEFSFKSLTNLVSQITPPSELRPWLILGNGGKSCLCTSGHIQFLSEWSRRAKHLKHDRRLWYWLGPEFLQTNVGLNTALTSLCEHALCKNMRTYEGASRN
jgi:hypothetical protein